MMQDNTSQVIDSDVEKSTIILNLSCNCKEEGDDNDRGTPTSSSRATKEEPLDDYAARDDDATAPISMETNSSHTRQQSSETIPLIVMEDTHQSSTHTIDLDLVQGTMDLKRIQAFLKNKSFVVDSEGDLCTLCTISTHESMDLDNRGFYGPDDFDDGISLYFCETASEIDSLDYSFSRSQDFWRMQESLEVRDANYFTEGFIDVGELPRVH